MRCISYLLGLAAGSALAASAGGAVVQTLSNPVADGSPMVVGGDRSGWTLITPYDADDYESASTDWAQVYVAHDSSNFYVRYAMNSTANGFGWLDNNQSMFIDADQNAATGFNGAMGIGADYLIEGNALHVHSGEGWSWAWQESLTYSDWPNYDQVFSVARSSIGNPNAFNFVLYTTSEDYYPNGGNSGATGDYFTYVVPEPSSMALLTLSGVALLRRRR